MRTIVVGAGFSGVQLARSLAGAGDEVVLVENDPDRARDARDRVDCETIEADGNNPDTLEKAGIATADALVALTEDDELNMITCAVADALNPAARKFARVRNWAYYERQAKTAAAVAAAPSPALRPALGIDAMLNPDAEAAAAICRAVDRGSVGNAIALEGGLAVLELGVTAGSAADSVPLRDLAAKTGRRMLVAWVETPDGAALPDGSTILRPGNRIGVVADPASLDAFAALAGEPPEEPPRRVAVFGAGRVGRLVAQRLLAGKRESSFFAALRPRRNREVLLVDSDPDRCREAERMLPGVKALVGDVTDEAFLSDEDVDSCDLAIAASEGCDANLVAAAYLKSRGVKRTIALTANASFDGIARKIGVDVAVPLRETVVDAFSGKLRGQGVLSVHTVCNRRLEIVECTVAPGSPAAGKALRQLAIPGEFLVLLVAPPDGAFAVPFGDTRVPPGGRVVLAMRAGSGKVLRIFGGKG